MNKIILSLLSSFLIFTNAQANICCDFLSSISNGQFYAEIFSGANFLHGEVHDRVHLKPGCVVSGSIGYRFCNGLRLEAEHSYRRNNFGKQRSYYTYLNRQRFSSGYFQSFSYMANLLWDIPLCNWGCSFWNIQPFIGAGFGYETKFNTLHFNFRNYPNGMPFFGGFKGDETYKSEGFAWQVLAGLSYPIFCNTNISIEYRLHKANFEKAYNHAVGLGLMYNFGS